ncbi:S8 family peptidase [Alkalihalobacterium chitinilyticum]|uniref:S8 family peptidase n=1 Tax=Alkalihalobacterium chitinilyticum TaxID=2980103 RepID=A0ABT5VHE8_9BACI|nr:S8 family peptidase [Alkalihalobacterium chitinilyticum]MDE5414834.1 S8 family peptidase [Alkalihalobacterium chitinilyticum]
MFGYSMVQLVRTHAHKLDKPLREKVLNQYKPFKWTPCFLHKMFEGFIKRTKKLSVIIEFEEGCYEEGYDQVRQIFSRHFGCKIRNEFTSVSCCSAQMTPSALEKVLTTCSHVRKIYLNREVHALLDTAVAASNARDVVRNGTTLTGEGVTIAVIDTGVYPHEDLSGRIVDFVDFINQRSDPYDDNGHGTHCAGDALGDGSASDGSYRGPAPKANLVGIKVLNKLGSGSLETVMQGVEYCIHYNESNPENRIDVINLSLGSPALRYENENEDPMVRMVNQAWDAGIVVCVAAGNSGPEFETIASPGVSQQVITVGAIDDRDTVEREGDDVASFSSRGPTVYGEIKPDILAPGVNIVSLRSPKSFIDKLQKGNRVGSDYITLSGTSMATPICAGIVALMLEHDPALTPNQVKERLMEGTDLWNNFGVPEVYIYGAGYINAENSIPE